MKYTPEQITELLEKTNNAIQLGYYPEFEQIKKLTEIVQQQTRQLSEAWKAYDNLKAEMEALGAELQSTQAQCQQVNRQLEMAYEEMDRAIRSIIFQSPQMALENLRTAKDRIKATQEGGNTIA